MLFRSVFFDLPVTTSRERREYARFRKYLITNGFLMMQESVYSKIALTSSSLTLIIERLKANKPAKGLVQLLTITEKQYARIESIVGESKTDLINDDQRTVIL